MARPALQFCPAPCPPRRRNLTLARLARLEAQLASNGVMWSLHMCPCLPPRRSSRLLSIPLLFCFGSATDCFSYGSLGRGGDRWILVLMKRMLWGVVALVGDLLITLRSDDSHPAVGRPLGDSQQERQRYVYLQGGPRLPDQEG